MPRLGVERAPSSKRVASVLTALLFAAVMAANPLIPAPVRAAANPIVAENQLPGTDGWQLGSLVSDDANNQIKGYASATSVQQGQTITLYVTVNPAQTYTIDIYRVGWYGGIGARLMQHAGPLAGSPQARCLPDQTTGMIDCNWAPSYNLVVPTAWTSGVYLGLLTNSLGYQNYLIFVVKDGRPAPLLYQQSVNTYQAYNNYPDDKATGKSLYSFNSYGPPASASADVRAVKVSFDRPYTAEGAGQFLFWEIDFVRWMERSGYDVTYTTDIDTHANGGALLNSRGFLAVGHDEYWSKEMYDAAQAARDAGVNLGYFGGNDVYWQVRFEPSARGVPNRVMVCYKDANLDPVKGSTATVNWRSAPANRPEQGLMGVQYTSQTSWGNNADYVVTNSGNWVYQGTGFADGDVVKGLVGYEMDRFFPNLPEPANTTRTILSNSPYINGSGVADYANSSVYRAPSGAWVFAAGTMSWSNGLDGYYQDHDLTDSRIQQTTANILNAFVAAAPPPPPPLQVSAVQATSITSTSAVIGWQTNNPATSRVDYGPTAAYGSAISDPASVTSHSLTLSNLTANTTYHYQVTSVDGANQTARSTDASFTTTGNPPLQISGVQAGTVTASSAVISWQTSNAADSRVDYGTTLAYGSVATDATQVGSHSLTLSGLSSKTTYHFQVTSTDGFRQTASSADATFTTPAPNLLANPGFESGSAYWQMNLMASIDTNPADAHSGNNSLKLSATLPWEGTWQYLPVTAGLTYQISGWERSTTAGGYLTLIPYDANNLEAGPHLDLIYAGNGSWSSLSSNYVPPAGTVKLGVGLQSDGMGTFWFDDVSLTQP